MRPDPVARMRPDVARMRPDVARMRPDVALRRNERARSFLTRYTRCNACRA
jgi:hypothetical protein